MNKGTVVTEYYFILLDTNMVPITYYLIKNKEYTELTVYLYIIINSNKLPKKEQRDTN